MYINPFVAGLITATMIWFILLVVLAVIKQEGKQ